MRRIILETGKAESLLCSGKNLAIPSSAVMWKVENIPNELGDAVKEIWKQCCVFHFFPVGYSKTARTEQLKAELINKKSQDLLFLKIHSLSRWHMILKLRNGFWAKIKFRGTFRKTHMMPRVWLENLFKISKIKDGVSENWAVCQEALQEIRVCLLDLLGQW